MERYPPLYYTDTYRTPRGWQAKCSCGWVSYVSTKRREAELEGDEHLEIVHGE